MRLRCRWKSGIHAAHRDAVRLGTAADLASPTAVLLCHTSRKMHIGPGRAACVLLNQCAPPCPRLQRCTRRCTRPRSRRRHHGNDIHSQKYRTGGPQGRRKPASAWKNTTVKRTRSTLSPGVRGNSAAPRRRPAQASPRSCGTKQGCSTFASGHRNEPRTPACNPRPPRRHQSSPRTRTVNRRRTALARSGAPPSTSSAPPS